MGSLGAAAGGGVRGWLEDWTQGGAAGWSVLRGWLFALSFGALAGFRLLGLRGRLWLGFLAGGGLLAGFNERLVVVVVGGGGRFLALPLVAGLAAGLARLGLKV